MTPSHTYPGEPQSNPDATGDAFKTLFIGRIVRTPAWSCSVLFDKPLTPPFPAHPSILSPTSTPLVIFFLLSHPQNYDVSESKLRREFETYGAIKSLKLVHDTKDGKPRGYAFIEFEHERDMHCALTHLDGTRKGVAAFHLVVARCLASFTSVLSFTSCLFFASCFHVDEDTYALDIIFLYRFMTYPFRSRMRSCVQEPRWPQAREPAHCR